VDGLPATASLAYARIVIAGEFGIGQLAYPELLVEAQCTAVRRA
jgi:hypothetical protein